MLEKYILNDKGQPQIELSLMRWAEWMESHPESTQVKFDLIEGCQVSTVFIGLNHNWHNNGPPVVWETMIFRDDTGETTFQSRCSGSREQAEAMHQTAIEILNKNLPKPV